ncbi:MAG: hypothetical protein NTZ35_00125 [Ignavibacteriales bacterium]|nr:hypothetical protein [Ignavibacteriales bacterium]
MFLLVIFASSVAELSAQTTSSAVQVVTFGARRIALQAPTASYVTNTMNQSAVKVTAGSQSRFQSAVDFRTTTSEQTSSSVEPAVITGVDNARPASATRQSNSYNSKTPNTASKPSGKLIVTLTE